MFSSKSFICIYLRDLLVDKESEKWVPMEMESLKYDLNRILDKLDKSGNYKKKWIMKRFYGLDWHQEQNIDEIAEYYWVTYNAIMRQKENTIRELRDDEAADKLLRDYMW